MPSEERDLLPLGTGFDVVRRGYDRAQVEEHLDRVEADLRILTADRDAAVGQASELARALDRARAHVEDLRGQVDRLAAPPDTMEGMSERLQRMLRLAQDEAREMRTAAESAASQARQEADEYSRSVRAEAEQEAHGLTTNAEQQARAMISDADRQARETLDEAHRQAQETHDAAEADAARARVRYDDGLADNERRRTEMEREHHDLMAGARTDADRIRDEAEQERGRLDEESRSQRQQVEDDFEIAMAARRSESMRVLARGEADARERAETQLRDAAAEAQRRVREADDQVAELRRLRDRVSGQMATFREALGGLPAIDAFPDEEDADGRLPVPAEHSERPEQSDGRDLNGTAPDPQRSTATSSTF